MNKETPKWEIKAHSYQIADTGDYDGHFILKCGDIELITKDDHLGDEEGQALIKALNDVDCKWEDWKLSDKEFELHLKQQEVDRWKEVAEKLYGIVEYAVKSKLVVYKNERVHQAMEAYEKALKQ